MNAKSVISYGILSLSLSYAALGQSSFRLQNRFLPAGVDAPVFDAQGVPLAGPNYLAELWGGATSNSLAPAIIVGEGRREIVPFVSGGFFISTSDFLSVLSVPPNGWAWLEVRAWDARLGTRYEEAVARGLGGYGESPLFYAQGNNPLLGGAPEPAAWLVGLESFSLREVIPEPSVVWLLLLGLPWLFFRNARKN